VAPANAWYQLYAAREVGVREDMIRRTADAGMAALVLTVDVPVSPKRERNIRNGFANVRGGLFQALSLKPSIPAEALTHPGWIVEYLRHGGGAPMMQNWQRRPPMNTNLAPRQRAIRMSAPRLIPLSSRTASRQDRKQHARL
jgi:FMN-dependent dehydrogenase